MAAPRHVKLATATTNYVKTPFGHFVVHFFLLALFQIT